MVPLQSPAQLNYFTPPTNVSVLGWTDLCLHKKGCHDHCINEEESIQHVAEPGIREAKNWCRICKKKNQIHQQTKSFLSLVLGSTNVAVLLSIPWKDNSQCEGNTAPLQRRWNSEYEIYRINLVKKGPWQVQVQLNQTVQALSQLRVSPQTEMFANSPGQHRVFIFWENPATSPEGICDWAWLRLPSSIVCEKIHCLDKILGEVFSILH